MDEPQSPPDIEALVRELAELGTGAAILGLRQVNITRRRLTSERPELEPVVDVVLDQIEALVGPLSAAVGAVVESVGQTLDGDAGEQVRETGRLVADLGPELLRLSGLTRR